MKVNKTGVIPVSIPLLLLIKHNIMLYIIPGDNIEAEQTQENCLVSLNLVSYLHLLKELNFSIFALVI